MKKIDNIELSEGCYGPDIMINGESLFIHEYDNRTEEEVREYKILLIKELLEIVDIINMNDLRFIGEIITFNNNKYELIEEEASEYICNQCGNWNYKQIFVKNE